MAHSDSPRTNWLSAEHLLLAGLLILTLVVRGSVLWAMRDNLNADPDLYREIAENLLQHGEFAVGKGEPGDDSAPLRPTAFRPPLYPVVLSNLPAADGDKISLAKIAVLHLLLGVATVWLTWLTAKRFCRVRELSCRVGPASAARAGPPATESSTINGGPALAEASWSQPTAFLAGLLVACDPILLNQQTLVMTETLATFLAILGLWCLARFDGSRSWFNAALTGGAIGLAVLCRPTFLPWLGLVGLVTLAVRGRNSVFRIQNSELKNAGRLELLLSTFGWRLANLAALGIVASAVIAPWAIRNEQTFGKPIVTTTHGGYTLYLGNNESFYEYVMKGDFDLPWDVNSLQPTVLQRGGPFSELTVRRLEVVSAEAETFEKERKKYGYTYDKELWNDRIAGAFAKLCMLSMPKECAAACVYRLRQLWSPLPYKLTADESHGRRMLRYATSAWYCGVYALAAIGIWRLRWRLLQPPWIWGLLLCLAFTAVHTFYWTNLRMRAPLMPVVALVAGAAIKSKVQGPKSTVEGSPVP
jgi:hypothetical protein